MKKMKLLCGLLLVIIFPQFSFSQSNLSDTVLLSKQPKAISYQASKFDLVGGFDDRSLFAVKPSTKIDGIRLGVELFQKFRFGYGYYYLGKERTLDSYIFGKDTLRQKLKLQYTGPFFEYVFFEDFRWEFSVPVSVGFGKGRVFSSPQKAVENSSQRQTGNLVVTSIGLNGHYRIFHWLGIGAGIGYNHSFSHEPALNKVLNSPFYAIRVKVFFGGLYRCVFKPQVVKAMKDVYRRERQLRRNK